MDRSWTGLAGRPGPACDPRAIIEDCYGLLDTLATPIARLERQITGLAKPDPRVQALQALPGIGKLTAMTLSPRSTTSAASHGPQAVRLAGLTPAVRNLRPQGPPRPHHQARLGVGALDPARGRPDGQAQPLFADAYAQLAHRRGRSIATVAIARRLLGRCFHILNQLEATTTGEDQTGCAPNNRMRLQHGRPA